MLASSQKALLLERVADAIRDSGWSVIFQDTNHPARMLAFNDSDRRPLLVYIWKITPGGPVGVRPSGEIRIQLTGVPPPFRRSTDFQTLLLGYSEEDDIFAGFDVSRRPQIWGSSPSVQLRQSAVEDAKRRGFGFYRRATTTKAELAIAFQPQAFMDYVTRQAELHLFADDLQAVSSLEAAAADVSQGRGRAVDFDAIGGAGRREAVRTVMERVGQQNFRSRVLAVYGHQCAVCSTQLNVLDAAHIVPVPGGGSNETRNGLSLCKLHHAAYDRGLVGVFPDYRITINELEAKRLERGKRDGGLATFRQNLLGTLREPQQFNDRPSPDYLRTGLLLRGWQGITSDRMSVP